MGDRVDLQLDHGALIAFAGLERALLQPPGYDDASTAWLSLSARFSAASRQSLQRRNNASPPFHSAESRSK
jgi:hypothetical protein